MSSPEQMQLRPMLISDYDAVLALWQSSSGMTLRDSDSREAIARYLDHNPQLSQVLLQQDTLIGAVLIGTDGRRGYLQHLAIAAAWQHQGLGRRLLEAGIAALQRHGIEKTHLFVHADNMAALQFYRHLGWQLRDTIYLCSFNAGSHPNI